MHCYLQRSGKMARKLNVMESWNSFKSRKYCEWYQKKNDVHLRWMYVRFSFVLTHKLMLVYTSSSSYSSLISAHCPIAIGWLVNKQKRIITCEYTRKKNIKHTQDNTVFSAAAHLFRLTSTTPKERERKKNVKILLKIW